MTDKNELLALADRVEALKAPDEHIDWLIENALGLARFELDRPDPRSEGWLDKRVKPKPYTASLDAAMTLVPDEYDWILGRTNGGLTIHARGDEFMRFGATPALAICVAAIHARAAQ